MENAFLALPKKLVLLLPEVWFALFVPVLMLKLMLGRKKKKKSDE